MPPHSPVSRRRFLAGLSAMAVVPVLAGCGSDSSSSSDTSSAGASDRAEAGALPVTMTHKYGTTTITKAPTRVVCVGLLEQDALLALGIVPVAVTKWFGEAPGQIFSWATDALGDGKVPTVLEGEAVQLEKIAGLRPDLIIGQYAGMKKRDYELLSKIAPTVAQPKEYVDYGVPWEVSTENIGKAVGRPKAAAKLVSGVQAQIASARKANPDFEGQVGLVSGIYEGLFVYGPQDPRNRLLNDLGFVYPKNLEKVSGIEFGASISPEQIGRLDHDLVVWVDKEANLTEATGGLSKKTGVAQEGRQVFVSEDDGDFYIAHSMLTPLSIPFVLKTYVPALQAAADGDPSTKIPALAS